MFRLGRPRSRIAEASCEALAGAEVLEIGGPSRIFSRKGRLPVYDVLATVHVCDFTPETAWSHVLEADLRYRRAGYRGVVTCLEEEASVLEGIRDDSYHGVLASHVLEHLANPLKALRTWRRITRDDAHLLLVLPHRDGTFDHRRPVTSLDHMIQDYLADVGEDDLTHIEEVLELHDLARDPAAGTRGAFEARCRANASERCIHHHVFDTRLALRMLDHAEFGIEAVDVTRPYHVMVLARMAAGDNEAWLAPDAAWRKRSPFPSDR